MRMGRRRRDSPRVAHSPAAAAAALALAACPARAQIYRFDHAAVPGGKSLQAVYVFYVYSQWDAPRGSRTQPSLTFRNLALHSRSHNNTRLKAYHGVQVGILPSAKFWQLIEPRLLCSTDADVAQGRAWQKDQLLVRGTHSGQVDMTVHTVDFPLSPKLVHMERRVPINRTGAYILFVSNCGRLEGGEMSGSVAVRNAYGFLPGNEYHRMSFYGVLWLVYFALTAAWLALALRHWASRSRTWYCVAAVAFLGQIEALAWWTFLRRWNHSGHRGRLLFVAAILSSVAKRTLASASLLVVPLSCGATSPRPDQKTALKVQAVCFAYAAFDLVRESTISFRHSHSLRPEYVISCLLPTLLINGVIFGWISSEINALVARLEERQQQDAIRPFKRLQGTLALGVMLATFTFAFQMEDLFVSDAFRWRNHLWFFSHGVSHIWFLLVLAAIMCWWRPSGDDPAHPYESVTAGGFESNEETHPIVNEEAIEKGEWVEARVVGKSSLCIDV